MCHANPTWGAPRIHGELLKLGIAIAEATVGHYMVRRRPPPSQTWRTFLTNHIGQLVSVDFFVVPTLTFRVLFVFVVLAHDRRQILHVNVTGYPTAAWTAQQIRNAFPWDTAPRFLLRDRDGTYGHNFRACLEAMEIDEVLTAPQSPWQNPYVERLIGSMRRECVDHVIVLNERSLHRILRSYIDYYHLWRTASLVGQGCARKPTRRACCTGRGHGDAARGRPAPQLPSSRGLTTAMDGRRRKTVHAARRPEERPKDASHSSTFTECTAAMLTLPSFAGPTSARSVTRTVRMRFSVGTQVPVRIGILCVRRNWLQWNTGAARDPARAAYCRSGRRRWSASITLSCCVIVTAQRASSTTAISKGVGARMRAGLRASNLRARHLPMRYETGLPSSVIRFRT